MKWNEMEIYEIESKCSSMTSPPGTPPFTYSVVGRQLLASGTALAFFFLGLYLHSATSDLCDCGQVTLLL